MSDGLFSFGNLHRCYLKCRRQKRNTANALRFEANLEENLLRLQRELENRAYRPARSVCFAVKKPKLREIFAADFRDRIVHHVLVSFLEPIYERKFIFDSFACRPGKGTHKAVERLQTFARQATANGTRPAFYLQLDLRSFFVSIDKAILLRLIRRVTANPEVLWLAQTVVNNDCAANYRLKGNAALLQLLPPHKTLFGAPPGRGLPIGNLTSQFFANVYLNELDQFVKHELKVKHYIRYVDDFVLLADSRARLEAWREQIAAFVRERLRLELHPRKQRLAPLSDGVDFLGYIVKPGCLQVRRRVAGAFKEKLSALAKAAKAKGGPGFTAEQLRRGRAFADSYYAHFNRASAWRLKNALEKKYGFLKELRPAAALAEPHYFPDLAAQYRHFRAAATGAELYLEEGGQVCYRNKAALVFFPVGGEYVFYGEDAAPAAAALGLRLQAGGAPPSVRRAFGPQKAAFPAALRPKYAARARAGGYAVYLVKQDKDLVFSHRLTTRSLAGYYPAEKSHE